MKEVFKQLKRLRPLLILFLFDALWILFILSRSLKPADLSMAESDRILALVQQILPFMTSFLIRKLGHFTEFFLLGVLLFLTGSCWEKTVPARMASPLRERCCRFFGPALAGLLTAVTDECIQLGVEGRSGEVRDVLIDFSAVLLALILGGLLRKSREKKRREGPPKAASPEAPEKTSGKPGKS